MSYKMTLEFLEVSASHTHASDLHLKLNIYNMISLNVIVTFITFFTLSLIVLSF